MPCPVGTNCPQLGTSLFDVQLNPGYYRYSRYSLDVRRCPDAGANCSGASECAESTSGCRGIASSPCADGLDGPFCQLCAAPAEDDGLVYYYVPANSIAVASCAPCVQSLGSIIGVLLLLVAVVTLVPTALVCAWRCCFPSKLRAWLVYVHETYTLHNKFKTMVSIADRTGDLALACSTRYGRCMQQAISSSHGLRFGRRWSRSAST